jgi:hypothetical protein
LLDETYYGDFSTYSFSSAVEDLSDSYAVSVATTPRALAAELADSDLLILKTPIVQFSPGLVEQIQEWVRRGGGVLAIGDHTDLLGMNSNLNEVLAPTGMMLRADSVGRYDTPGFAEWSRPTVGAHPSVAGLRSVEFMTGCSIRGGENTRPILWVKCAQSDPADYSRGSNFPSVRNSLERPSGVVTVAAESRLGRGIMVALGDSTPLSSFDYYKRNNDRLLRALLRYMEQPSEENLMVQLLGSLLALALAGTAVVALKRLGDRPWGRPVVVAALGGLLGGVTATRFAHEAAYPVAVRRIDRPEVAFAWENCSAAFPTALGSVPDAPEEFIYDTLFVAPQRLGMRTRVAWSAEAIADSGAEVKVWLNLAASPRGLELARLRADLREGRSFVVFQSRGDLTTTSPSIQMLRGLGVETVTTKDAGLRFSAGRRLPLESGSCAAFELPVANGRVVFVEYSRSPSRAELGHCMRVPSEEQLAYRRDLGQILRAAAPDWVRPVRYRVIE